MFLRLHTWMQKQRFSHLFTENSCLLKLYKSALSNDSKAAVAEGSLYLFQSEWPQLEISE